MRSARQPSQAIVEFGIIALLFTLLMFAVVDFGLLLNDWLSLSAGTRGIARDASVGLVQSNLNQKATAMSLPGISADSPRFSSYCCTPTSAVVLTVTFYPQCVPGPGPCNPCLPGTPGCTALNPPGGPPNPTLDSNFGQPAGGCTNPAPPAPPTCAHPGLGDTVVVTIVGAGAQVITPLVRPFFNGPDCLSTAAHCYVPLSNTVVMRFEGNQFP